MSGDNSFTTKALMISGAVIVGSGVVYLFYQQSVLAKKQKHLSSSNALLSQKLVELESEIKQLKEALAASSSSSSEEVEEIFVDASEITGISNDSRSMRSPDDQNEIQHQMDKLDTLLDEGGLENLRICCAKTSLWADRYPKNDEILWRLARCAFLLASEELMHSNGGFQEEQKALMEKARNAAQSALKINEKNGDAHKWMAIIIGSITQFLPMQEQIKSAYVIKDHIQSAIKYKPTDSLSYHMLGRWCYSVYMLSWVERKVASALFAQPPTATLEEALECFLKAENLQPKSSIDNCLYLAKSYIAKADYVKAMRYLKSGELMKASSRDDMKSMKEILELKEQYKTYVS